MTRRVTEIDKLVGKRLRNLRISKGFSQMNLAKKLNISFQQIQKYEKGINRISVGRLYDFMKIFEVDANSFFEDTDLNNLDIEKFNGKALLRATKLLKGLDQVEIFRITEIIHLIKRFKNMAS